MDINGPYAGAGTSHACSYLHRSGFEKGLVPMSQLLKVTGRNDARRGWISQQYFSCRMLKSRYGQVFVSSVKAEAETQKEKHHLLLLCCRKVPVSVWFHGLTFSTALIPLGLTCLHYNQCQNPQWGLESCTLLCLNKSF